MLSINMDDVMNVLTSIKSYLIAIGIIVAAAIIIMVAVMKVKKPVRRPFCFERIPAKNAERNAAAQRATIAP